MIKKLLQAAILVAGGLALGGCPLQQQAKTTAPANKPPAADYMAASTTPAPAAGSIRGICYNEADLAIYRGRMVQQEFVVATLQCQNPGGSRAYHPHPLRARRGRRTPSRGAVRPSDRCQGRYGGLAGFGPMHRLHHQVSDQGHSRMP